MEFVVHGTISKYQVFRNFFYTFSYSADLDSQLKD